VAATRRMVDLVERLAKAGIGLAHIDVGGGIGIRYRDEAPPPITDFLAGVLGVLGGRGETLIVDPGRAIVGSAGILLTRVEYVKPGEAKNYLIVDAAMNDLLRPALYNAWHEVRPVRQAEQGGDAAVYDVVGPVCESGDFLAKDREINRPQRGDLLAVMSAGAYGFTMASNYNSHPKPPEVLVDGDRYYVVRRRESFDDLINGEAIPAALQ